MTNSRPRGISPARARARRPILFFDCLEENVRFRREIEAAIKRVLDSGYYVLGRELEAFETELAGYCGVRHAIGVGSGLDAITLILEAMKHRGVLRAGDEVIVPANCFIAPALAVSRAGLTPAFCDIDPATCNLGLAGLESALTARTRAILAVHLYGRACDMDMLGRFARERGLTIIEDAAQAIGTRSNGRPAGGLGHAAAFSFYPTKSLGALGDGGAITTDDDDLCALIRALRNYGGTAKYRHEYQGANSRLDELQAAILRVKLPHLDACLRRKREIAARYSIAFRGSPLVAPDVPADETSHSWHLYAARSRARDAFIHAMRGEGVVCGIHYPVAIHRQPAYAGYRHLSFPHAERACEEVVSLPMGAALADKDVREVIDAAMLALDRQ